MMRYTLRQAALLGSAMSLAAGLAFPAAAQDTAPPPQQADDSETQDTPGAGDIVVTAQRRAENVQDIPIAIQAIGGTNLASAGVAQIGQLATLTPSFVYSLTGPEPAISLRGIGGELAQIAGEPSVSLALDGVPLLRQQYFLGAFFDVDRVEILRGPQGTIAGRSATGGAVNIITRRPTFQLEGGAEATYGNYDTQNFGLWASGPVITDKLAVHFAVERRKSDGYVRSTITGRDFGGHDDIFGRVSLLARPTEGVELLLSGDYYNSEDNSPAFVSQGLYDPAHVSVVLDPAGFGSTSYYNPKTRKADIAGLPGQEEVNKARSYGVNFQGTFDLSDTTTLKSVTGYRELRGNQRYDSVRAPISINSIYSPYQQTQFSQELTLTSSFGDDVDILFGGQYLNEDARQQTSVIYFYGLAGPGFSGPAAVDLTASDQIKLHSYAAFGQIQWRFLPTLQLTLGGRYTSDKKIYRGGVAMPSETPEVVTIPRLADTFNAFTPRIALDWKPSNDVTVYASVSKGFKAGGYGTAGALTPGFTSFQPETVWNYEAGIKTNLFDRLVTANLTGFWADYKELQYPFHVAPRIIITNAGSARIRGLELELGLHPGQGIDFGFNATYLDAKYREFNASDPGRPAENAFCADPTSPAFALCLPIPGAPGIRDLAGFRMPKAPKLSFAANGSYRFDLGSPGALTLRADVKYQSKVYFTAFNTDNAAQKAYALVNLRATYDIADSGLSISAFARNLFDKGYFIGKTPLGSNLAGLDPRLPGDVIGGVPVALVPVSTLGGVVGEPRMYGVTVAYKF